MKRLSKEREKMNKLNLVFLILLTIPLQACGMFGSSKEIVEKPVIYRQPELIVQEPPPVVQQPVEWLIITKENLEKIIKEVEAKEGNYVFFALTPKGYENLSINVAELRTHIMQKNAMISAYKTYYANNGEDIEVRKKTLMQRMLK